MAGRAVSSGRGAGRNFVGRIGATESPPWETVVDSDLTLADGAFDEVEAVEEVETFRIGEKLDIAEPGRAGMFLLAAMAAFFCASIVSRRDGFGGPEVLLEKPKPGRATASGFLGEFGLSGAFSSSLCCVASNVAMILSSR